jgi:hypothetical protein
LGLAILNGQAVPPYNYVKHKLVPSSVHPKKALATKEPATAHSTIEIISLLHQWFCCSIVSEFVSCDVSLLRSDGWRSSMLLPRVLMKIQEKLRYLEDRWDDRVANALDDGLTEPFLR